MAEHKLVVSAYQPKSFPAYRYYRECSCGFQCRLSTEVAADTQFDSHLRMNGVLPEEKPVPPKKVFDPFGKKEKEKDEDVSKLRKIG